MFRWLALAVCALTTTLPLHSEGYDIVDSSYSSLQDMDEIPWMTNFTKAQEMAKKEGKPIFLFFTGSDWCSWCMKMEKEILKTPEFIRQVGQAFIFVKADFPTYAVLDEAQVKQNEELKNKYKISGFPTIIILDPNGNIVARMHYEKIGGDAYAKNLLKVWGDYKAQQAAK